MMARRGSPPGLLWRVAGMIWVLPLLLLAGCSSIGFYAQAIYGHLDIVAKARPIDNVVRDPATPVRLRQRLLLATDIRNFASRELGLPDNGSYRRYADLGRRFVVWNVVSAPEFSVDPIEHCFPVAGCVSYRGYFREADASSEAARERALGRDAHVGGVAAYSTLGWYDDPLLNTFVFYSEAAVARLVIHELAHQVAYASGDTVFNESFAMVVAEEGVRRWLSRPGAASGAAAMAQFMTARQRRREFTRLLLNYRERLRVRYAAGGDAQTMRAGKAALLDGLRADYRRLKASWGGYAGYDRVLAGGTNNALLASVAAYNALVPALTALLARERNDLPAFYRAVKDLAGRSRDERRQILAAMVAKSPG